MHGRPPGASAKMLTSVHFSGYYMRCYIPESSGVKLVNNRKNATEDTEDVAAFNRQQIWRAEQFHEVMQNLTR